MAEEPQESTGTKMICQLTNLASMRHHDIQELVWENGQILLQSLSKITQNNPPCEEEMFIKKGARYRTADSVSGNSLLGLHSWTHQDKLDSSYPNRIHNSSLQDRYQEISSELYENNVNVSLKRDRSCYTKQHIDSQIAPVQKFANHRHDRGCSDKQLIDSQVFPFANHKQDYASKFLEGIPQHKITNNSKMPRSSLRQFQGTAPFINSNQAAESLGGFHQLNFEVQNSGNIRKGVDENVSIFFGSPALPKAKNSSYLGVRPMNRPGSSGDKDLKAPRRSSTPVDSVPGNAEKGTRDLQNKPSSVPTKMKPTQQEPEPRNESAPDDEQSVVVGQKHDPANRESIEHLISSSSICSDGASNNSKYFLKRKYEETKGSAYPSENDPEEPEGMRKVACAQRSKCAKRNQNAVAHNLSEKKRTKRKMRALQELIPNSNKADAAAILDEATEYIKTLQLQLQMILMRSGLYMSSLMLPRTMQQINAPPLAYSPNVVGMDMRMQMCLGYSPVQFPTSSSSGVTAPAGITEARLSMQGCAGQVLPMSVSCSPFLSFPGRPSTQSVPTFDTSQVAALMELQCPARFSAEKES